MLGVVYKITSKIDGKIYIGQTMCSLKKRWREHCGSSIKTSYISNAINKYGKDSFEIKIIAKCESIEEMNHREIYYINIFRSLSPSGYNLDSGGKNKRTHPDTKIRLSLAHTGSKNGFFGKKHSKESKQKISISKKYKKYGMSGKKHSDSAKHKIGIAHLGKVESIDTCLKKSLSKVGSKNSFFGRTHSEETKEKMRKSWESRISKDNKIRKFKEI